MEQRAHAERMAAEIEGKSSSNIHMREERNMVRAVFSLLPPLVGWLASWLCWVVVGCGEAGVFRLCLRHNMCMWGRAGTPIHRGLGATDVYHVERYEQHPLSRAFDPSPAFLMLVCSSAACLNPVAFFFSFLMLVCSSAACLNPVAIFFFFLYMFSPPFLSSPGPRPRPRPRLLWTAYGARQSHGRRRALQRRSGHGGALPPDAIFWEQWWQPQPRPR